jgi:release factor glutamine methyltransferase
MNIHQLITKLSAELNSREHAWWMLEAITNKSKSQLLFEDIKITPEHLAIIEQWVSKMTKEHYPIQYLIGKVPFLDCEILVESPILIPRPETEEWCADLIEQLKALKNKNIKILDMCTGSGCIAISIAKAFPQAQITAVDISNKAVELTKKNIKLNNIKNIEVIKSDLFKNLQNKLSLDKLDLRSSTRDAGCDFDLIISNPPYIDETLFETLDLSVKNWEDSNALISKNGGLLLIQNIIKEAPSYLTVNLELQENNVPNLVIEMDETQGEQITQLMHNNGFTNIQIKKDLYGKDRVVYGLLK